MVFVTYVFKYRFHSKTACPVGKGTEFFPTQMAHRLALLSVSIALSHTSADAVKEATVGNWSTGSHTCSTFPLYSFISSTRRDSSGYDLARD